MHDECSSPQTTGGRYVLLVATKVWTGTQQESRRRKRCNWCDRKIESVPSHHEELEVLAKMLQVTVG